MASFWFLKLALKCFDYLSWPVLALVYPLCASIDAIENDSHSDTRKLISYWILLSLIYLFEYAFLQLLQWFQYWNYMKLMIIAFLVIPDFGRASYVYNQLIWSFISMNPQAVISRFRNWKKIFVKKEDFLMHAERFITENGTGALENLIASKQNLDPESKKAVPTEEKNETQKNTQQNLDVEAKRAVPTKVEKEIQQNEASSPFLLLKNTQQNLDAETIKTVPTAEKDKMQQKNTGRLHMEQKDVKDLEMIVKEEVPQGKQANTALYNVKSNENTSSTATKTKRTAVKDAEGEAPPPISASNVQKEWTCALCQIKTTCQSNLNSHYHGKKHKAACEALKPKRQVVAVKVVKKNNDMSNGEPEKMTDTCNALEQKITTGHPIDPNQKNIGTSVGMNKSMLRCYMCDVKCTSEGDMASHLRGRKHLAQSRILYGS